MRISLDVEGTYMAPLIRLENISKSFSGTIANDHITLEFERGEIHGLLGENGAGKTTLMNCVYGIYKPDSGNIQWKGEKVHIRQTSEAICLGIGMVHQHFMLVPTMTVAENVILGLRFEHGPLLHIRQIEERVRERGLELGFNLDPRAYIWQLPIGVQQKVEILKALYRNAELLILDEPTAVLTPKEVDDLFDILRKLASEGRTIILISHKLEEVRKICHRVSVLRNGKWVKTLHPGETNTEELARLMLGRDVNLRSEKNGTPGGEVVLSVESVCAKNDRGFPALDNVSIKIRRGEILGIAGVDGNGQLELSEVLAGLRPSTGGRILILGKDTTRFSPKEIIDLHVGYIPSDRQKIGLILEFSIKENLIGKSFRLTPYSVKGYLKTKEIDRYAQNAMLRFDVRAADPNVKIKFLSGGNQQKVILARELEGQIDLLIAAQPSRGLDVGATEYVHDQIRQVKSRGAGVLLISTELDEIFSLADRIAVIYAGRIMGIIDAERANRVMIGEMMAGITVPGCQ